MFVRLTNTPVFPITSLVKKLAPLLTLYHQFSHRLIEKKIELFIFLLRLKPKLQSLKEKSSTLGKSPHHQKATSHRIKTFPRL